MKNKTEILFKVAEKIRQHPERHNQSVWMNGPLSVDSDCGTKACVAGWATVIAGYNVEYYEDSVPWPSTIYHIFDGEGKEVDKGEFFRFGSFIAKEIGLSKEEEGILFAEDAEPLHNMTFPEALEKFAAGADIEDCFHSHEYCEDTNGYDYYQCDHCDDEK